MDELFENNDIVMIQEHWLFHSQIPMLNEVRSDVNSVGKGTDINDPMLPTQMPRGYGGVGILWKKELDSKIKALDDGGKRIQCIQIENFANNKGLILCSVYLPSKGIGGNVEEFCECIDQLREICLKYFPTNYIIIGGDLNETLGSESAAKRTLYIKDFIDEFGLNFENSGKTYVDQGGAECTEIDYFLYNLPENLVQKKKQILRDIDLNVSDHHPIRMDIVSNFVTYKATLNKPSSRVNWKKVDTHTYALHIDQQMEQHSQNLDLNHNEIDHVLEHLCNIMSDTATASSKPRKNFKSKPKLKMWNQEIKENLQTMKKAYSNWRDAGKSTEHNCNLYIERNISKKLFRASYRQAIAKRDFELKQKILKCRKYDSKYFHKLVNSQRQRGTTLISDLHVGENCSTGEPDILNGFRAHFEQLATESRNEMFDEEYHENISNEIQHIEALVTNVDIKPVTSEELDEAINGINTGKSPDIYNISIEHLLNCTPKVRIFLLKVINQIFQSGNFPSFLKNGLVSPIYKKKGQSNVATNYRGITVLPVIGKVVEAILRDRISPLIEEIQNNVQRGFTKYASPMNSALMVEELYRESKDNNSNLNLIFLDAKSAFDVVDHNHLLRRLYYMGVADKHWTLISSFHKNARSSIKWCSQTSKSFAVHQGVRQGGILSTDLYKIYVNPLLNSLQEANIGSSIGNVRCAASACADDICLCAEQDEEAQLLLDMSADFANMERYLLQPTKSVHVKVSHKRKKETCTGTFEMNNAEIPTVTKTTHLGIIRTESISGNQKENTDENLRKARRAAYGLFGSGLRGQKGLNIVTIVHLYKTYVSPVLLYGLELLLPTTTHMLKLETFQRKFIKEVLQLPDTTANAAVYMITGLLPVEAQIHIKALTLLHNIGQQSEQSIEKQILFRQLNVKSVKSNSWFIEVERILWKYELGTLSEICAEVPSKFKWKTMIHKQVNKYWSCNIGESAKLYKTLRFMKFDSYNPGSVMPVLRVEYSARESYRLQTKLRLLTGTYTLQTTRKNFNQFDIDTTCQLCGEESETESHFVLECSSLDIVRGTVLPSIALQWNNLSSQRFDDLHNAVKLQIIINCWPVITKDIKPPKPEAIHMLEIECGRLLFNLDRARILMLGSAAQR